MKIKFKISDTKMINQELEHLYSPSKWSKRLGPSEVIQHHVSFVTAESEKVRSSVPNQIGLRYGPKEAQKYDLFGGDNIPADAPVFIYIHGGYWQQLSRDISAYCVLPLTRAGVRVAVVGYTLAPQAKIEEIVAEIRSAIQVIVNQASEQDCKGVWVSGHSAGAHLAVTSLLCSPAPLCAPGMQLLRGLVLISGVYHLAPLCATSVNQPLALDKDSAAALSPLAQLGQQILPAWARRLNVLLAVAEHDSPAFIQQTKDMAQVLEGRVATVQTMELPGLDHFDIVEKLSEFDFDLTKKIVKLISGK